MRPIGLAGADIETRRPGDEIPRVLLGEFFEQMHEA
jgi:hypothetical protein